MRKIPFRKAELELMKESALMVITGIIVIDEQRRQELNKFYEKNLRKLEA